MAEEFFDIVNERDEPIGRALRDEVHARELRHRAVLIFVFNAGGRIFLQKRSMTKDVSPGLWTVSCSGHVDAGEEYDTAARRELGEELGLYLANPPERWFRVEACAATDWEFSWMYRTIAEGPFILHPTEIEAGQWIEREKLERWLLERPQDFCPGFRWIWTLARGK